MRGEVIVRFLKILIFGCFTFLLTFVAVYNFYRFALPTYPLSEIGDFPGSIFTPITFLPVVGAATVTFLLRGRHNVAEEGEGVTCLYFDDRYRLLVALTGWLAVPVAVHGIGSGELTSIIAFLVFGSLFLLGAVIFQISVIKYDNRELVLADQLFNNSRNDWSNLVKITKRQSRARSGDVYRFVFEGQRYAHVSILYAGVEDLVAFAQSKLTNA